MDSVLADWTRGGPHRRRRRAPHLLVGGAADVPVPVAIIFVIFQRYFVRGAAEGGERG